MSKILSALGGPHSLLIWSRLVALAAGLAIVAPAVGCDKKKDEKSKKDKDDDDDDDEKPKKKTAKSGSPVSSASGAKPDASGPTAGLFPTAPTAPSPSEPAPTAATPTNSKYPDMAKLLGDKSTWVPTPFKMLKEDMLASEVGKIFPGAEKTGEFGIVEVPVTGGEPGVWRYQFLYLGKGKDQLAFVEIQFDPKLSSDEFWKHLVEGLKKKYGDKFEAPSTRSHTWTGTDFKTVELSEDQDFEFDPPKSYFAIAVMI